MVIVAAVILSAGGRVAAYDAIVAWYPVGGAAGYRVYTREAGQSYGSGTNVGGLTPGMDGIIRYRKIGLRPDRITYFAIACYNGAGATSALSNELWIAPPSTPTPRRTSTAPRPTNTPPCTPLPGGGCAAGPGDSLVITRVRLQQDTSPARDNGRLRVNAILDEGGTAGLLETAATSGDVAITVQSAGPFAVLLTLTDCRSTSGSIRCQTGDERATAKFKRVRNRQFLYSLSLEAHHLTDTETGPEPPQGPVSVTVHEAPGVDHHGTVSGCPPPSNRALVCSQP